MWAAYLRGDALPSTQSPHVQHNSGDRYYDNVASQQRGRSPGSSRRTPTRRRSMERQQRNDLDLSNVVVRAPSALQMHSPSAVNHGHFSASQQRSPYHSAPPPAGTGEFAAQTDIPELKEVVQRFALQRLFHDSSLPMSATPASPIAAGSTLPGAPRRPVVVDWLLTSSSSTTVESNLKHSTANGVIPMPNDNQHVSSPPPRHFALIPPPRNPIQTTMELLEALEAQDVGDDVAEPEVAAAITRHSAPETAAVSLFSMKHSLTASSPPVNKSGKEADAYERILAEPLSSASFAKIGVAPPRTGSSESLDETGAFDNLDMNAVRKAFMQPSQTPSTTHRRSLSGGGDAQSKSDSYSPRARHVQQPQRRNQLRRSPSGSLGPVIPLVAPLDADERELLERGFRDFSKRSKCVDQSHIKSRLFQRSQKREPPH